MNICKRLNKDVILENFNQIEIFAEYLNLDVSTIEDCIKYKELIHSPIRENDPNPSAGFKYNNKNKLKLKDFGGYFWGDCFDLVAYMLKINVNDKSGFMTVLEHIYRTMYKLNNEHVDKLLNIVKKEKHVFKISIREFNNSDRDIWQPIIYRHIVKDYLRNNYVYPIDSLWIDPESQPYPKYQYNRSNPAYAYYQLQDRNKIDNFKIYYPKAKYPEPKFKTNCNLYQNLFLLPKEWDVLIITKSYKDVISMKSFLDHIDTDLEIAIIAPPFEQYIMLKHEYEYFAERTNLYFSKDVKAILSIYDLDYAGLNGSGYLKRKYSIPRFMFKDFKRKDFTDNIIHYGKDYMFNVAYDFVKFLENILQ